MLLEDFAFWQDHEFQRFVHLLALMGKKGRTLHSEQPETSKTRIPRDKTQTLAEVGAHSRIDNLSIFEGQWLNDVHNPK